MGKLSICIFLVFITFQIFAQTENLVNQPYLETIAVADTLVEPDVVHLTITLDEKDSKNRKSTEELEVSMFKVLNSLGIDTDKNLSLLDFNSDFRKIFFGGQKILKAKMYSLTVNDTKTLGDVMRGLEKEEISNVFLSKAQYSKAEQLLLELRSKAVLKAKQQAEKMVLSLGQKIGEAIYISDLETIPLEEQGKEIGVRLKTESKIYGARSAGDIIVDFNKIRFSAEVKVIFRIE